MSVLSGDGREIRRWVVFIIWLAVNAICFGLYHRIYDKEPRFRYFQDIAGASFPVTRASAACINLNVAVVLLPVCRNLNGYLRTFLPKFFRPFFDADINAHKTIAYCIVFWATVHCLGHFWNLRNVTNSWIFGEPLAETLNTWGGLNPVSAPYTNVTRALFSIQAGYTGVMLAMVFFIMVTTAAAPIRRSFFELFWYAHHLFVFVYPLLHFHGDGDVIKQQTNTVEHDPDECGKVENLDQWGDAGNSLCPGPTYIGLDASSWKWFLFSLCIYGIELGIRWLHVFFPVAYVSHNFHLSNVLEIRFSREQCTLQGNHHEIGQFVFIKIPAASMLQWHPFTLTSAPEDDFMMVHIRAAGDWTKEIHRLFKGEEIPKIIIDGPYGAPSQGLYDHDIVLCCGTGIGITPFASFLRSLLDRARRKKLDPKRKVYFVWIASQMQCFEWFDDLLREVEEEVTQIKPQIYLTMSNMDSEAGVDMAVKERHSVVTLSHDPVTRLTKHRTRYGRPDWHAIFTDISAENRNKHVSVFACGPKPFTKQLAQTSDKFSKTTNPWVQFHFYKENF